MPGSHLSVGKKMRACCDHHNKDCCSWHLEGPACVNLNKGQLSAQVVFYLSYFNKVQEQGSQVSSTPESAIKSQPVLLVTSESLLRPLILVPDSSKGMVIVQPSLSASLRLKAFSEVISDAGHCSLQSRKTPSSQLLVSSGKS